MKKTFSILLCFIIVVSISGCSGATDKKFENNNFSIVLPTDFKENKEKGYDYYFEKNDCIIAITEEKFENLGNTEISKDSSALDYSNSLIKNNAIIAVPTEKNQQSVFFEYDATASDGNDYHYYNFVIKGEYSFWICRFVCLKSENEKLKSNFEKWSSTIEIK